MRHLTKRQKSILLQWVKSNKDYIGLSFRAEDLPSHLFGKLEEINNFETIYQAIENFVIDNLDKV